MGVRTAWHDAAVQGWEESDSELYRRLAPVAVPARREQLAVIAVLVPRPPDHEFHLVDLACGEGVLARCLLSAYPRASLLALDGSESMRSEAARLLAPFGARARVEPFTLVERDWLEHLAGADCVVSSLALHHLSGADKRRLFADVAARLNADGALLVADLVEARRAEVQELFAASWDGAAEEAARQVDDAGAYRAFVEAKWNHYRFPDPMDRPSPLFDQLLWLRAAGFAAVDCFWMRAGHAIYGGYLSAEEERESFLGFSAALEAADGALAALEARSA